MSDQPPPAPPPGAPWGPPSGPTGPATPPPGTQPGYPDYPGSPGPNTAPPAGGPPGYVGRQDPNTAAQPNASGQHAPERRGPAPGVDERGRPKGGRISAAWTGAVVTAILLIALIIFIAQNSAEVTIHFLGFDGRISLALALLIAAVGSVLLVAIPGSLRIMQLRRSLRRSTAQHRTAQHR